MGSAVAQTANVALVAVLLTRLYSIEALGEYSLVQRVLGLPLVLIAGSVGQVYFQRASAEHRERGDFLDSFMTTLRGLATIAIATTLILYLVLPLGFSAIFGSQWVGAENSPAACFLVSPCSSSSRPCH